MNKNLFTLGESYHILFDAFRTIKYMVRERRTENLSTEFIERIMLAVTEVNHCPICSYAHTKMALEAGMTAKEIESMLAGLLQHVPTDELPAIMFAQHYANTRGKPTRQSWKALVHIYGLEKAQGILGGVRAIMAGNAYGIPWSSLQSRLKGKPDPRSSLTYELIMIFTLFPYALGAMVHTVLSQSWKTPLLSLT